MLRKKRVGKRLNRKTAVFVKCLRFYFDPTLKNKPVKFNLAFLFGVSLSLINVRFIRREDDVIEVYRNKRKPIRMIKEGFKNEDGCIACSLFDVCLEWTGRTRCTCEVMEDAGVIEPNEEGDRFFINVSL